MITQAGTHSKHLLQCFLLLTLIRNHVPRHLIVIPHQRRKAHLSCYEVLFISILQHDKALRSKCIEEFCEDKLTHSVLFWSVTLHVITLIKAKGSTLILGIYEAKIEWIGIVRDITNLWINGWCKLVRQRLEHCLDVLLRLIKVYIADDSNELQVRTIPFIIELLYLFLLE